MSTLAKLVSVINELIWKLGFMKGKGGKTLSGRDIQIGVEKISYKKFGVFFSIDQKNRPPGVCIK